MGDQFQSSTALAAGSYAPSYTYTNTLGICFSQNKLHHYISILPLIIQWWSLKLHLPINTFYLRKMHSTMVEIFWHIVRLIYKFISSNRFWKKHHQKVTSLPSHSNDSESELPPSIWVYWIKSLSCLNGVLLSNEMEMLRLNLNKRLSIYLFDLISGSLNTQFKL